MSILNVQNVTHAFGGRQIFENVSFRLLRGDHVGLVGANGEGKSTFMNIILHKLEPDAGEIEWMKRIRVGYLDQHAALEQGLTIRQALAAAFQYLFDAEAEMNSLYEKMAEAEGDALERMMEDAAELQELLELGDFYMINAKVEEVAHGLGLAAIGLERDVFDLSGGQRTKILLAKLLLQKPDVLLLDEPTNYLDEEHIAWLKVYLQNYENAFILISHDISFLNDVVNLVYHVENTELTRYVGNYDQFTAQYELAKRQLKAAYERQQAEIAGLQDFIARNKARVATSNMAKSRQKKLDKMDLITLSKEKPKPEFRFLVAKTPGKTIVEARDLVIGYNHTPLTRPVNLSIERGQKVALTGANGLGKTTLLKSFLGEVPAVKGASELGENVVVGYFEQEPKEKNTKTCIDDIWSAFPAWTQYEVRRALAKCGLTTEQLESRVYVLSGGEQAKVRLCKIMNTESNFLVLDEPTNHLDADAKEALKTALQKYSGSLLMVCHEPEFYNDVVTHVWDVSRFSLKVDR